jgi:hypothetical protein
MAKILEQIIAIKLSKIVKNDTAQDTVITADQLAALLTSIPELAESIIDDSSVVVELMDFE